MQIRVIMRYQLTPVRMAIINKATNKCWQGCGEKETLVGGNAAIVENSMEFPQKTENGTAF